MSTPKGPAVKSAVAQGNYTESWRFATEDPTLEPQYYGELVQLYGGLTTWDAMMLASHDIDVSTRLLTVLEQGYFLDTIDVASEITASGVNTHFHLLSTKNTLRVGFVVHVPAKYITGAEVPVSFICTAKSGTTGSWDHIMYPLVTGTNFSVNIPVSQSLIVGGSMYAAGTGQPAGLTNDFYRHEHTSRILKESVYWEGGQGALMELKGLQSAGNLKARSILEAQMRMRVQLNDAFLMGYPNSQAITQVNRGGDANKILGDVGLIPAMVADAMKLYYTGSFNEDHFDIIPFLLASQGVTGGSGMLLAGMELNLGIENSMLTLVKEYSGGTDIYEKLKGVGFGVREMYKNGFSTKIIKLPELSNPVLYGAAGYNFESLGMLFPDAKVTATLSAMNANGSSASGSEKKSLNNATIGYLNFNGENRRLITGDRAGVNGYGIPFSDDWDDSAQYTLCEMMNIFLALNQTILVLRTDV